MSYYYNYYIGYKKDGMIYPLGPYNARGELCEVFSRSRSFASDLHNEFYYVGEEQISDELRKEFTYKDWDDGEGMSRVKYLPVADLPEGNFIKSGYYLIEDVKYYLDKETCSADWAEEMKRNYLPPEVYAAKAKNEMIYGAPAHQYDEEGGEFETHSASEYMYFAFPDYWGKEYEIHLLLCAMDMLERFDDPKGAEYVILETEG